MEFQRTVGGSLAGYRNRSWPSTTLSRQMLLAGCVISLAVGLFLVEHPVAGYSPLSRQHHSFMTQRGLSALSLSAQGTLSSVLGVNDPVYRMSASNTGFTAQIPAQPIDPLIRQGGKLVGDTEIGNGRFGIRVALSADGNTALVGSPGDDNGKGAVWAFERSGSTWIQQGTKFAVGGEEGKEELGFSVALSGDGNIALIGSPGYNNNEGAAWVFTRGTKWFERSRLSGNGEEGAGRFGAAVALSADDSIALVGAPQDLAMVRGAVWAFQREGALPDGDFKQQGQKLVGEHVSTDEGSFGESVALSSDGNTALIGDPWSNMQQGVALIFTRSQGIWTQSQVLEGEGEEGPEGQFGGLGEFRFGESVALSGDGSTALVGGPEDNRNAGAIWTFERSGSGWTQQGEKLTAGDEIGEGLFGTSVALSSDANIALIGAPGDNVLGGAWMFVRSGSTWVQEGERLAGLEESGLGDFGSAVALSAAGDTAVVGGPADGDGAGAAWLFVGASPPTVTTGAASNVGAGTATLNGTVDPNELPSSAHFQYGTTAAYGQSTRSENAGSGDDATALAADLTGLTPGTTYHFRIVAGSSASTSYGTDQIFTTALSTSVAVAPVNTVKPTISGTPIRRQALSVSQGSWSNSPTSFAYQWQSCDAAVKKCLGLKGPADAAHILTQADVGHRLRAIVTGSNAGGSGSATSTTSPVVGSQVEAAMTWTFGWARNYTIVGSFIVHKIPAGGIVEVICHGHGCPFSRSHVASAASYLRCGHKCKRSTRSPSEVNLTLLFKGHHLGVGTHITVNIVKSDWVGKSFLFTVRTNQTPRVKITCVALGPRHIGGGC